MELIYSIAIEAQFAPSPESSTLIPDGSPAHDCLPFFHIAALTSHATSKHPAYSWVHGHVPV